MYNWRCFIRCSGLLEEFALILVALFDDSPVFELIDGLCISLLVEFLGSPSLFLLYNSLGILQLEKLRI